MSAFFSKADVKEHRFRLSLNVCFRPGADVAYLGEKVKVASRIRSGGSFDGEPKSRVIGLVVGVGFEVTRLP